MNTPVRHTAGWRGDLAALFAGGAIPFSLAPYNFWWLGMLSAAVLAILLAGLSARRSLIRCFAFGVGMYGAGASWVYVSIHNFGFASAPLATFLTSLLVVGLALVFALPFYLYSRFFSGTRAGFVLGFTAFWVLGDWFRSWFLTGFPWLYLGYGHIDTWLSGWAPVLGVFGVTFIAVLSAVCLVTVFYETIRCLRNSDTAPVCNPASATALGLFIVGLWLTGFALQEKSWTRYGEKDAVSVTLIQPNIPQEMKWQPLFRPHIMQTLRELTSDKWHQSDIIIWPEASIPLMYHEADAFLEEIELRAEASGTALISGILYDRYEPENDQPYTYYNSIIGLGEASGMYFKQRLVPFGEYVPLEKWLRGLIAFFNLPTSIISAGPKGQAMLENDHYRIATFICYEVVYPDLVRGYAEDSEILVTISNDAWFGDSIGPLQHFQMAQMRALENGRYMLRGTNTGLSSIISDRGESLMPMKRFEQTSATGTAYLTHGTTPFGRTGSWPIIFLSMAVIAALTLTSPRRKPHE